MFYMFGSNLSVSDRMLHYNIAYVLLPKHLNHSRINELELQVIYVVKNNIKVNWAFTILHHMGHLRNLSGGLPYAWMITTILNYVGMDLRKKSFEIMTTKECEINDKTALKKHRYYLGY